MDASIGRWHRATETEVINLEPPRGCRTILPMPATTMRPALFGSLALKAGVFIGIPVIAAIVAVLVMLK